MTVLVFTSLEWVGKNLDFVKIIFRRSRSRHSSSIPKKLFSLLILGLCIISFPQRCATVLSMHHGVLVQKGRQNYEKLQTVDLDLYCHPPPSFHQMWFGFLLLDVSCLFCFFYRHPVCIFTFSPPRPALTEYLQVQTVK